MPKIEVVYFLRDLSPQITYVVTDKATRQSAVINPIVIFDKGQPDYTQLDDVIEYISENDLSLDWILDTHFSPHQYLAGKHLQQRFGGVRGIGETAKRSIQSLSDADSSLFMYDEYFIDGELFLLGHIQTQVVWVPGYMPCCVGYVVAHCIFAGNCMNLPNEGVSHCGFSTSRFTTHYESIHKLLAFPNDYKLYVGYSELLQRPLIVEPSCTVLEQKRFNSASSVDVDLAKFSQRLTHHPLLVTPEDITRTCAQVSPYLSQF